MPDGTTGPQNGISGGYKGGNPTILRAMLAFTAIAWYNAAELIILVFVVFKRFSGLYFWSLLITSLAIIPYSLGAWGKQVELAGHPLAMQIMSSIGWVVMVPGQSLVLYSRLHCITQDQRLLRGILIMIIVDTIVLTTPTVILSLGSNTSLSHKFAPGYAVMEKIQMTWFTIQELIISAVYLVEVRRALSVIQSGKIRKTMFELLAINLAIIVLDIALLTVEFLSLYQIEVTLKSMVYSIKLKLEFGVLSKLVKIATSRQGVYNLDGKGTSDTGDDGDIRHDNSFITPSFLTNVPTNSTYDTARPFTSAAQGIGRVGSDQGTGHIDSEPNHDGLEKCYDFETNVSFSSSNPIPKPSPNQQLKLYSQHCETVRRRSSISDLYPGRLDPG